MMKIHVRKAEKLGKEISFQKEKLIEVFIFSILICPVGVKFGSGQWTFPCP